MSEQGRLDARWAQGIQVGDWNQQLTTLLVPRPGPVRWPGRGAPAEGVDLVVWVNASSRESILTTYAEARAATEPDITGSTPEAAVRFLTWLGTTDRAWLIVLDDVTDPADVRGLWPNGPKGRILVTTRR